MEIKKVSGGFNSYRAELSYGELQAIAAALEKSHFGPVADELYSGLRFYLDKLPRPGEDEDDDKEGDSGPKDIRSLANELRTPDELEAELGGFEDGGQAGPVMTLADLDRELPGGPPEEGQERQEPDREPEPE